MSGIDSKIARYGLFESDLLRENGHVFVELVKLGFRQQGSSCLVCGIVRRRDGCNSPCKGPVEVSLRETAAANK